MKVVGLSVWGLEVLEPGFRSAIATASGQLPKNRGTQPPNMIILVLTVGIARKGTASLLDAPAGFGG